MGHLRLVTDTPPAPARRRGFAPALSLTSDEAKHLRAAVRGLARTRYANLVTIARELGVDPGTLTRKRHLSPGLAVAIWRLTGIPMETLLRGGVAAVPRKDGAS